MTIKMNKNWFKEFSDLSREEVQEYLDLAEFFILGKRKWIKKKDNKWNCTIKRLFFKNEGGKVVEPQPYTDIQTRNRKGQWIDEVLYRTISPNDAEEVWLQITFVLCDIARKKGERLGKPLKPKIEERKEGELPWNKEAVASPQYKLVSTIGFNIYNQYVAEYEKKQLASGLTRVEMYGSFRAGKFDFEDFKVTLDFTEDEGADSTDHGNFVYKLIKYNDRVDKIKEFLQPPEFKDLDERLRKMSPQERALTIVKPNQLLFGAGKLTPKDQEDGWDLAYAYRTDLKTTLMTHAEIFEHLRREPICGEDGKRNNNYKLHVLSFLIQALGMSHRDFVLLCSYFAGHRIYFPAMPSITYEGRKRLVDYVLSNTTPAYILPMEEVEKMEENNKLRIQQEKLHEKVDNIVQTSYQSTKEDERENHVEKTIYEFIFTGKRKGRIKEEVVIKIFNEEIAYRIEQETQRKIDRRQVSDIEKQLGYDFACINKWLGAFQQIETGDDFSEYSQAKYPELSQLKRLLKHIQNPAYIGIKKAQELEKEKELIHTGISIGDWIKSLTSNIETNKSSIKTTQRKLAVLKEMRHKQKEKADEADDRTITFADLEILELEMWKEDIEKETDKQIKTWRKQFKNGEHVILDVHKEFDNAEETYKRLEKRAKIQREEKQEYYERGLQTIFGKCKKLKNLLEELEKKW